MDRPIPNRRRTGFTLIEILVVIGIILVLMGLAVLGYNVVEKAAAGRETKTTLADLHAMLAELDADAGSAALPNPTYQNAMMQTVTAEYGAISSVVPTDPDAVPTDSTANPVTQVWSIDDVTSGGAARGYNSANSPPYSNNVMQQTSNAMGLLMNIPANKAAVAQLPSKLIMKVMDSNPAVNAMVPTNPPILLDGWGNPIIYVPSAGICVYTTVGTTPTAILIKSHDGRPFFASAGPDGNFGGTSGATQASGDDNVYSIEK